MGFFDGYNVATSGMSAQRTRINVVSANIANAKTTHTADGGPYKKQEVVFEDVLVANSQKKTNNNDIETTNSLKSDLALRGVGVGFVFLFQPSPMQLLPSVALVVFDYYFLQLFLFFPNFPFFLFPLIH